MLVAGVPRSRGAPVHFEDMDDGGYTQFNGQEVTEIHTSHKPFVRIHELMHARHTDHKRHRRVYKSVPESVANMLEDIRLHAKHWPWRAGQTPKSVKDATIAYMREDREQAQQRLAEHPEDRGGPADFLTRLRAATVLGVLIGDTEAAIDRIGFAPGQDDFALSIYRSLRAGNELSASKLVASAFFPEYGKPPPKPPEFMRFAGGGAGSGFDPDPDGGDVAAINGYSQPEMDIIELPHTEHVEGASVGERRATMGSRMYRPALRRPLLPQRLFVRRTPQEPGGTILIDASGSMGDMDNIKKWLERAPFGTIAYYAGDGEKGWLWVYARDGKRAAEIEEPDSRGNTVDGPALTWLMNQPGPRTFVTDRGFCDCNDSQAQVARLAMLEGAGEVKVVNYNNEDEAPAEEVAF